MQNWHCYKRLFLTPKLLTFSYPFFGSSLFRFIPVLLPRPEPKLFKPHPQTVFGITTSHFTISSFWLKIQRKQARNSRPRSPHFFLNLLLTFFTEPVLNWVTLLSSEETEFFEAAEIRRRRRRRRRRRQRRRARQEILLGPKTFADTRAAATERAF
jgi:hypothetical protein